MKSKKVKVSAKHGDTRIRKDFDKKSWRIESVEWILESMSTSKERAEKLAKSIAKSEGGRFIGENND